ncbi:MAG TPA: caspase family protein, partial [Candidatus Deferrimicrobium sp.]|nr:caspase family protein [Candidatus Deferrimicrobium sp.]
MLTETDKNNKSKLPFVESHAFIIGINNYRCMPKLRTAINDANKLAEVLAKEQGFNVHPPLLNADREDIRELLEKIMPGKIKPEDRCLFYFAGHGIAEEGEGVPEGYLIPVDARPHVISGYYSMKDLYAAIRNLKCKHFLLILDSCFSGAFKWSSRYRGSHDLMPKCIFKERFDRFVKDPAWQVITSADCDQNAIDRYRKLPLGKRDDEKMNHSPFAAALFEGLQGAADIIPKGKGDGLITATELYLYLREQVEPETIAVNENIRQTPGLFPLEKHDKGEFVFFSPNHILNLPADPGKNPYKGLESYEEGDADLFYGREQVIKDLLEKVERNKLVVVTGASGTGKSSVVKAGLLPELRRQGYYIPPVIRPGKLSVDSLENVFLESDHCSDDKTILVIDQLEELITQVKEDERNRCIRDLKKLLEADHNNRFKIILTVRADFEPHFKVSELEPYWPDARYPVPPLTAGELREIIINPTVQVVMEFEPPELVYRIIDEVIQAPGALPLLSFTLSELYRSYIRSRRTNRTLNEEDYKKLGGVSGALNTRADDFYKTLDQAQQDTLRKIMRRMVSIEGSEPARKKISKDELTFSQREENERVEIIIDQLVEERLVIKENGNNNQYYVEPAHDALINSWVTFRGWLNDEGKINIILQNRLGAAVNDYYPERKGKLWHDDTRLDQLKENLDSHDTWLNRKEETFVRESIKLKESKKKRKRDITFGVIAVLSALLIFAFYKEAVARKEARIAQANYLASQAQLRLESESAAAISLAKDAYLLDQNKNVTQVLSTAAAQTLEHPLYNLNFQHDYYVNSAVFSHSGNKMLTASEDKTVKLWDPQGKLLQEFTHENAVTSAVFSPDDQTILTVSRDKAARLWNLQGRLMQEFTHEKIVTSAVFSPDGLTILTASNDNTARLWNLQGELLKVISHRSDVNAARFSPDGTKIFTLSRNLNAWLLDMQGKPIKGLYPVNSAD